MERPKLIFWSGWVSSPLLCLTHNASGQYHVWLYSAVLAYLTVVQTTERRKKCPIKTMTKGRALRASSRPLILPPIIIRGMLTVFPSRSHKRPFDGSGIYGASEGPRQYIICQRWVESKCQTLANNSWDWILGWTYEDWWKKPANVNVAWLSKRVVNSERDVRNSYGE